MRQLLRDFSQEQGLKEIDTVSGEEHMDDGTPIRLAVTIDRKEGSALLDFEGVLSMPRIPCVPRAPCSYSVFLLFLLVFHLACLGFLCMLWVGLQT